MQNRRPKALSFLAKISVILGGFALFWSGLSTSSLSAESPPNLVVILVDDLGFGDLSSYGAEDLLTPEIDLLVSRGMKFENFYANCCVCSPTRASLLTGCYPERVGVPGVIRTHPESNWGYLAKDATLIAQPLGKAGYHTGIVGKWHLGLEAPNRPNDRGFDHFHGFLGDMMDDYYDHLRFGNNYMRLNEEVIEPEGHATEVFTDWACEYVKSRADQPQPFFLYLAYNAPHTPIQPPEDWVQKVKQRQPEIDDQRASLVALIEHMDAGIGRFLDTLKKAGLEENTMVIFTSDNGGQVNVGANNGPWRSGKGSMYEGGVRVPGCAVWPGKIEAGSTTDRSVLTMDIYPTLLEAAQAPADPEIDGVSFLPTLLGKEQPKPERTLYFIRREGGGKFLGKTIDAVIQGEWKILQNTPFSPLELYNLKRDPQEENDLMEKAPKIAREMGQLFQAHVQRGGLIPWQKPEAAVEEITAVEEE
ncbi:N-acetylgalactosamine 6-sulfate sulfatase [Planctomycetales bacterium 10988]|nr:N-acetylgalactosamine 6-sulfate sulfatase [Planctomycetales bacterium 10988]